MAGSGPNILVIANDRCERKLIAATLADAGFVVVAAEPCDWLPALRRERFAAAVVAMTDADGGAAAAADLLRQQARRRQPRLPLLLIPAPAGLPRGAGRGGRLRIDKRPLDPSRLLDHVVDLVLGESEESPAGTRARRYQAAELSIAAAQLACLENQRTAANAAGCGGLAQELSRQIRAMRTAYRGLAKAAAAAAAVAAR